MEASIKELVGPAVARILARRGIHEEGASFIRRAAEMSRDEILDDLVKNFRPEWAESFKQVNKIVRHPHTGEPQAIVRVEGLDTESVLRSGDEGQRAIQQSKEAEMRMQVRRNRRGRDRKRKVYKLVDFFNDHSIASKFDLTEADIQLVRRTAVIDPAAATRSLEAQLRNFGHDCVVIPGEYARGIKAARVRLHRALENSRVAPPDVDMVFIGQTAVVEGPRNETGQIDWSVTGSARNSPEVAVAARLALLHGVATVRALFEEDLVTCGVVLVEEGRTIGNVQFHYGGCVPQTVGLAGTDGLLYGDSVRAAAHRVAPLQQGGRVIATAVRLSSDTSYANWHVLENGEQSALSIALPGDTPIADVARLHEVAPDVWAVEHVPAQLEQGTWVVREADVDETCVLVYATPAGAEFSDPIAVIRKETGTVVTTRPAQARKGVSGAALVALSDGALLGVYRGSSFELCSCAVIAPSARGVQATEVAIAAEPSRDSYADSAFDQMARRGLSDVLRQALSALRPVFVAGRHIGYTARYGSATYTTLDCDVWPLTDASGRRVGFERVQGDKFKADVFPGQAGLGFVRLPRVGERVYVMGSDNAGAYLSAGMTITRLASDHQAFWLSADPAAGSDENFVYSGALVVADSDGAVVGQFASAMSTGVGIMSKCLGFVPRTLTAPVRREAMLNNVAPGAMVELWDSCVVQGLIQRDDDVIGRFSALGQSVLNAAVVVESSRANVGVDVTAALAVVSDPSWISSRAFDCQFHHALRPHSGVGHFSRPADRLADAFRAFIGMMATWQGQDQVILTLRQLGWFDFEWGEEVSRLSTIARSPLPIQAGSASRTPTPSP